MSEDSRVSLIPLIPDACLDGQSPRSSETASSKQKPHKFITVSRPIIKHEVPRCAQSYSKPAVALVICTLGFFFPARGQAYGEATENQLSTASIANSLNFMLYPPWKLLANNNTGARCRSCWQYQLFSFLPIPVRVSLTGKFTLCYWIKNSGKLQGIQTN